MAFILVNKVDHLGLQGRRCRRDLRIADLTPDRQNRQRCDTNGRLPAELKGARRQVNPANRFRHYEAVAELRADVAPTLRKGITSSELR
jgi:hypothetical protein